MTGIARTAPPASAGWQSADPWIRFGYNVCVYLVGGLILWSALVSIHGAVVAAGSVTVESNYKTVQHLDGGIVSRILVRNGDRVGKGDILLTLDATAVRANHAIALGRAAELLVQRARIEAERDGRDTFQPPEVTGADDAALAKVIASQRQLFGARLAARNGERAVLAERLTQLDGDLAGFEHQLAARMKEREINGRELASVLPLFERGYVNQQRIGPLQREQARLDGEIGRIGADKAKLAAQRAEADLRLQQASKAFAETIADEQRKVEASLAEAEESLAALADKLARIEIRAPSAGRVHAMAVHTEGGVITPASPLMQIIPEDETLVVEAQLPPGDIDKVRVGLRAGVRFPAFNSHTTPRLEGTLARISPAEIVGRDGRSYFTATVEIAASEIAKIGDGHSLKPGMPAEVLIETSERSILSYFVKPLMDALARTFRE